MEQAEVEINLIKETQWQPANNCNFSLANQAHVWRIDLAAATAYLPQLEQILQNDEADRANRYRQQTDRIRFISCRAFLRLLLGRYTGQQADHICFTTGINKKPYMADADIGFNVSHSRNWAVIAITHNRDIGVDTERIDPSFDYSLMLNDYFSQPEIDFALRSPENFFLLWTRKESLTKATGQGLDDGLKYIPSLDGLHFANKLFLQSGKSWRIHSLKLDQKNWASVAFEKTITKLNFFEILPDWQSHLLLNKPYFRMQ